jgi:hypothetical protein
MRASRERTITTYRRKEARVLKPGSEEKQYNQGLGHKTEQAKAGRGWRD